MQFLHFPFTTRQVEKFKQPGAKVMLAIGHDQYGHAAVLPETVRSPDRSPEADAAAAEMRERIRVALAALPERQRMAVVLFDVEGYPHADIAELLGIPEGTARSDVFHGRRALRQALGMYDPAKEDEP